MNSVLNEAIKKYGKFLFVAVVLFGVILVLSLVEPQEIVAAIGAQNVYLVTFLLAIVGGVSALSATGFYATLFTFALGGVNPFLLAAFSAPGVLVGDFVFWYFGSAARQTFVYTENRLFKWVQAWLAKKPRWFVLLFIYVYTGMTFLPGDLLMIVLAFMGYRFRQIVLPTLLGNFTLALIVAFSATLYYGG